MKQILPVTLLCTLTCICSAQTPVILPLGDSAELFGKDVISTGDFSFNTSFTPGGNTVFFSRATINFGYIAIFCSTRKNGQWQEATPVNFTGIYRDTDPFVSADGKRLYFSSDRPVNGQPFKDYDYHLFYVTLDGNNITGQPQLFMPVTDTAIKPAYPSFAANGNFYFFSRDSAYDTDIYMSEYHNGKYLTPVKLPFNDKKYIDFDPMVAKDESFIVFVSNNRKGEGSSDLFISFKENGTWSSPVNMGTKVNTKGNDGAPGLSQDNNTLYFTSYREESPRPAYKKDAITNDALMKLFHATSNGMRHIYKIDISRLAKKAG
ncbi:MAG TPA: hypothetical protein VG738_21050 [Chitinophagaceae bacterium]|nr:hypothetical protein [Chitinophagaceae bacterium]